MKTLIAVAAVTGLVATPLSATVRDAAYASSSDRQATQTSLFAGATYRVGLDNRAGEPRGRASLAFAGMARTPANDFRFGQGLEISRGQTGKPALFMAGQDVGQVKDRANLSGGTTAIIVGGVILLVVVAAVVISDYQRSQRCIGEEGDCD